MSLLYQIETDLMNPTKCQLHKVMVEVNCGNWMTNYRMEHHTTARNVWNGTSEVFLIIIIT